MTDDALIAAGFKRFPPNYTLDKWDELFQLRVRDDFGTRYFLNVMRYDHPEHRTGWQAEITFNDGAKWHPPAALRVTAYGGVADWTAQDAIEWAGKLWRALAPSYYEMEGAADA
jgi:hypothetical protein